MTVNPQVLIEENLAFGARSSWRSPWATRRSRPTRATGVSATSSGRRAATTSGSCRASSPGATCSIACSTAPTRPPTIANARASCCSCSPRRSRRRIPCSAIRARCSASPRRAARACSMACRISSTTSPTTSACRARWTSASSRSARTSPSTPGAVVYRGEAFELIQYTPQTERVHRRPLRHRAAADQQVLRHGSLAGTQLRGIRRAAGHPDVLHQLAQSDRRATRLEHGDLSDRLQAGDRRRLRDHRRGPGERHGGVRRRFHAGDAARAISRRRAKNKIASATLLVTVLDTEAPTMLGQFASRTGVAATIQKSRAQGCARRQRDGARVRLAAPERPRVAVRREQLGHGQSPARLRHPLLELGHDATAGGVPRRPAAHVHGEPAEVPGKIEALGTPIDMSKVDVPAYVVAGVTDHITPWQACYQSRNILRGKIDFVLSSSGHIQSIVNPPTNPKAKYFLNAVSAGRCRRPGSRGATRTRGQLVGALEQVVRGARRGRSARSKNRSAARCIPRAIPRRGDTFTRDEQPSRRIRRGRRHQPARRDPARATGGLPLLLFNGIGANLELCFPFMEAMPEKEIVIFDVPGVGRSEMSWRPRRFSGLARLAANCSTASATSRWT